MYILLDTLTVEAVAASHLMKLSKKDKTKQTSPLQWGRQYEREKN